jgi:hypothetical protein
LAAAFGGTTNSTFTDFLKIVNASPAYVQQLNDYLNNNSTGINVVSSLSETGADGRARDVAGVTNPTSGIITISSSVPSNTLSSTAGYQLAVTVAHELGHYTDLGNGGVGDGAVGEARAELNAYNLLNSAVGNLIASADTSSTSTSGNLFLGNPDNGGKPFAGLTSFQDAQSTIEGFTQGKNLSALNSTCGIDTACEAAVANVLANNEYKGYYPSNSAPALVAQNGNYQLYTDPANPNAINVVDDQTGKIVQSIDISATEAGSIELSINDLLTGSSFSDATNTNGLIIQTSTSTTASGITTSDLQNFSPAGILQNEIQSVTQTNGSVSMTISGVGATVAVSQATVTFADGAQATIVGSADAIHVGANDQATLTGTGDTVSVNGLNDNLVASSDTITLGANAYLNVTGGSNAISLTGSNDTLGAYGGGNNISLVAGDAVVVGNTNGTYDNITASGVAAGGVTSNGNGTGIYINGNSQVNVIGSNDAVNASTNDIVGVYGGGDTIGAGSGTGLWLNSTNGNFDTVYANGASVNLNVNTQANVQGSSDTLNESAGDSLGVYGGSDTINTVGGALTYVAGTNGAFDQINASGDSLGGTTANGQPTGIYLASNSQANVSGSGDGINESAGDSLGVYGGSNTINTTVGALTYVASTNGALDQINASGDYLGGTTANGQSTGIFLGSGSQASVSGDGNGISEAGGDYVGVSGNGDVVSASSSTIDLLNSNAGITIYGDSNVYESSSGATGDTFADYGNYNTLTASNDVLDVRENGVVGTVTGNYDNVGTANGATGDDILDAGNYMSLWANSDTIDMRANGTVATVTGNNDNIGTAVGATGNDILDAGNYLTMWTSGDTLDMRANGTVATVTGNNDYVGTAVGATGDDILDAGNYMTLGSSGDTIDMRANGTITTVTGSSDTVATAVGATSDTIHDTGANMNLAASGDILNVDAGGLAAFVTGNNDLAYGNYDTIVGSGSGDYSIGAGDVDQGSVYSESGAYYDDTWYDEYDPLVLNLQGGDVQTQSRATSNATFDVQNSGQPVRTGWATAGEGMLVYDPTNPDGPVTQDSQVVKGFGALKTLDSNGDGVIDSHDQAWKNLRVWVTDGTGNFQSGQLETLDQLGITSINVNSTLLNQNSNGNTLIDAGTFTWADGSSGNVDGVAFDFTSTALPPGVPDTSGDSASQVAAMTSVNQLISAMASFAPPPAAQTSAIAANDSQVTAPLLAAAH